MTLPAIALLGRKDEPTDAVEEYCRYLSEALQCHDIRLEMRRVPWESRGWSEALRGLRLQAANWRGTWVLVQYTALAWSRRGFPLKFLGVLKTLKSAGARIAIVFHDVEPYPGGRMIDSFRRAMQIRTMRRALGFADLAVFTVPPDKISWCQQPQPNVTFIPVGPNLPVASQAPIRGERDAVPTVGVFSITGGRTGAHETETIVHCARHVAEKLGPLRLSVFGRHAELRERDLRNSLRAVPVEVSVEGVVSPEKVVERLAACDVLLFVRGGISSRRSSAIAGIACGVPVIAYTGAETAPPITEAGVVLVDPLVPEELSNALIRVLSDGDLRASLRQRNTAIYAEYLCWPAIAKRFAALLQR